MAGLTKRGKVWYAIWYEDGRKRKQSLKTTSRARAAAKVAEIEKALEDGRPVGYKRDCAVVEFTEQYHAWLESNLRPHTAKGLKHTWKHFTAWANALRLSDITPEKITEYRDHRLAKGYAASTTRSTLLQLSSIFTAAINELHLFSGPNPCKGVALPEVEDSAQDTVKYLTTEQRDRLLQTAAEHSRDLYFVFALGCLAGLRKNEIANARRHWISLEGTGRIDVKSDGQGQFKTKSGKARTVPLNARLREILEPYLLDDPDAYLVYPGVPEKISATAYRVDFTASFNTICKRAGLDWVTPHVLRHTFAAHLAQAGVSLWKLSQWLGHTHEATTKLYAHLCADDPDINKL